MKSLLLAFFLAASGLSAAPVPKFNQLSDYMTPMRCDQFSRDALSLLHSNGIPAHRIVFGWFKYGVGSSSHAAVLFQWEGKIYFMDNDRMAPRIVAAKTDLGCVNSIIRDWSTQCWMKTDDNSARRAPRKISDMFAPAPEWLQPLQVGR